MSSAVTVRVPASTANLGPGFDAFSMALEEPHLNVEMEKLKEEGSILVEVRGPYSGRTPKDPSRNSAALAFKRLAEKLGYTGGVRIVIDAAIPVAKGLGSSGAEAVGAVRAGEKLLGASLTDEERIMIASSAEPGGHADNVIASLLGGFNIISKSEDELTYLSLPPPTNLGAVVIVPSFEKLSTAYAREVLTRQPTLSEYSQALSKAALMASAIALGKVDLFVKLAPFDPFIERVRANAGVYGPGYTWDQLLEEKKRLVDMGVALCISGSGPSRILFYDVRRSDTFIERAVEYLVERIEGRGGGIEKIIFTRPSLQGARLLAD
ncbi:MAG: homoserine kinase [Nitrososphaerota archaeon]